MKTLIDKILEEAYINEINDFSTPGNDYKCDPFVRFGDDWGARFNTENGMVTIELDKFSESDITQLFLNNHI